TNILECVICKSGLEELCLSCQTVLEDNEIDEEKEKNLENQSKAYKNIQSCVVVWGKCEVIEKNLSLKFKHAFHSHCMNEWLKKRLTCPLDNKNWEPEKF
ncbi:MAG: RING-box protein hrt1, partial [Paramarteilia canceri]